MDLNEITTAQIPDVYELNEQILRECLNGQKLKLINRRIFYVEPHVFEHVPDIVSIDLSQNFINHLPTNTFKNCLRLKSLKLNNNLFLDIPYREMSQIENLTELMLGHNLIAVIEEPFIRRETLTVLDLSWNQLTEIGRLAFDGLPQLTSLDLSHNRIVRVHHLAFLHNKNLLFLMLNNNCLHALHDKLLSNVKKLQILNLQSNQLKFLDYSMFENNLQLVSLNLVENVLSRLHTNIFDKLFFLNHLKLHVDEMVNSSIFKRLRNLEYLLLKIDSTDCCQLNSLFNRNCLQDKHKLKQFILIVRFLNCQRTIEFRLPESLSTLHIECLGKCSKHRKSLNLSRQMSLTPKLKKLVFIGLKNFHILNWNRIVENPVNFEHLEHLNVSGSYFMSLNRVFLKHYRHLKHLDLSFCHLNLNFKNCFDNLELLEYLNLEGVPIKHIRFCLFKQNKKLQHLNLMQCSISRINDCSFAFLKDLKYLNLKNNPIKELSQLVLYGLNMQQTKIEFGLF